jgi:non-specific serine/threonine protein kinase
VAAAEPASDPEALLADIVSAVTDDLMRMALSTSTWRASLRNGRTPGEKATRALVRALSEPRSGNVVTEPNLGAGLALLRREIEHLRRRAEGEPVVSARLRLALPADEEAGWPLTLEIVDRDDPSKWCTADDVRTGSARALLVSTAEVHLAVLRTELAAAEAILRRETPWMHDWIDDHDPTVDVQVAAAMLDAIDLLHQSGLHVIVPHELARVRPAAQAVATPREQTDGKLGATALVQWAPVVDGTPIAETALHEAERNGAALVQVGERWVQISRADARRVLERITERRQQPDELSAIELLQLAAEVGASLGVSESVDGTGWAGDVLAGLPDVVVGDGTVPDGFVAELRPYQKRGLGWLQFLHRLGLGGCLADDMGLGKTPTTLAHLVGIPGPHLVVCPLSVVRNWQREAHRFTPFLRVAIHHGTSRADAAALPGLVAAHDLVITTYQVAARDIEALVGLPWQVVVLDEAQAVKNPETATARAVRRLPARQHLALTGTPVENRLTELWSILSVVSPGLLGNLASFRRRFATPIERHRDVDAANALRQLTAPFVLRRTKADKSLVPDLPDKVEQIAWATLTPEQARMYQGVVDQLLHDAAQASGMKRRGLVLAALTRLKQICNHPAHALGDGSKLSGRSGKLHRFDELVADLLDAEQQALVFTQFTTMGSLLQQHLRESVGLTVPFLHGGVARRGRDEMVDEFQAGQHPLLLVSLKAGGTGLNLTAASRVVHYDRWWNPAVEDQATDRAWRIGQHQSVFVHKLVCEGTVEERIDALITDKRALADAVIGTTGEAWLSELSTDDLRDLVTLDLHGTRNR